MDQLELGRALGYLEATQVDHGRRISKLEERQRREVAKPMQWLPHLYGLVIIGLALAGKITVLEAIKALGAVGP